MLTSLNSTNSRSDINYEGCKATSGEMIIASGLSQILTMRDVKSASKCSMLTGGLVRY
mgnify:CR=1 FL=1